MRLKGKKIGFDDYFKIITLEEAGNVNVGHSALMHDAIDDVAVVIRDIKAQEEVKAVTQEGHDVCTVRALENIPLGHKIAVRDMPAGKEVLKYGRSIGKTAMKISKGAHVHNQNIKSVRWA